MFRLGGLVIVLLTVTCGCNAACRGAENTTLTFNLNGTDPRNASSINWFYYGLNGNVSVTVALTLGSTFVPGGSYGVRVKRQNTTNVNLILSQPATPDEGTYGCQIAFTSSTITLDNSSLQLYDGATPGNLALSLTYNSSAKTLECNIPGLTSLGDAEFAISDGDRILARGTSPQLTYGLPQATQDKNFTCFLTGRGAVCSDVASNGTVFVLAPTPTPGGPFPSTSASSSTVPSSNNPPSSASGMTEPSTPSTSVETRTTVVNTTVVTPNVPYEDKNHSLVGAIVGGIVAGIIGLAIICIIGVILCKRLRNTKGAKDPKMYGMTTANVA